MTERLTTCATWDQRWDKIQIPSEFQIGGHSLIMTEILRTVDRWLPKQPGLSAMEIGGAVGQYLAFMHRHFGYDIHCMDYSPVGCGKTEENFRRLGIPGQVRQSDLFSESPAKPEFDIVYSMGFVEHFTDLDDVIGRHLAYLKPGGTLMIGVPHFAGLNLAFLRRLAPRRVSQHYLETMDIRRWDSFERRFCLERIYRGYLGGLHAGMYYTCEDPTWRNRLLKMVAGGCKLLFDNRLLYPHIFAKINFRCTSCFAIGVWRKPLAVEASPG